MDGSVFKKKVSQLHSESLLRDSDEISLWELLGFLEKKNVFFFHWCDFPFSGVVQSCFQCFSQRRYSPCTLFWWNEYLRNTSKKEWIDSTFVRWIMQKRLNEIIGNQLWYGEFLLVASGQKVECCCTTDRHPGHPGLFLPLTSLKSWRKKKDLFAVLVLQPFSHTSITGWGWARGRMSS